MLLDPPYEMLPDLLPSLATALPPVLTEAGLVVLESAARLEPALDTLATRTSRRYGAARITLLERP